MDTLLKSALNNSFIRKFYAVQIKLIDRTVNLIDGSGEIKFNVDGVETTFTNRDDEYGLLSNIDSIEDAIGSSIQNTKITFLPTNVSSIANFVNPVQSLSYVKIWFGVINDQTGLVIGQPELRFYGLVDNFEISLSQNTTVIDVRVVSFDYNALIKKESQRSNDTFQQYLYPGDDSLSFTSTADDSVTWGSSPGDASSITFSYNPITSTGARAASI